MIVKRHTISLLSWLPGATGLVLRKRYFPRLFKRCGRNVLFGRYVQVIAPERIIIGEEIKLTIVRIGPNNVRLGIDAPREMNIVREELVIDLPVDPRQDTKATPVVA